MPKFCSTSNARSLTQTKRLFDQWRKGRSQGGRIPQNLWQAAARAAADHGVQLVADRLHLNVARLTQWVEELGLNGNVHQAGEDPQFVEIEDPLGALLTPAAECLLELEEPGGRKLRVSLKGQAVSQAPSLAAALWKEATA